MEHITDKNTSTALILPKENADGKVVILTPSNGVGKLLIREDTILANIHGCTVCGRGNFTCSGVEKQWSVLCWGKQSNKKYYCMLILLLLTFALSLIGTAFFCFTNTITDAVLSNMVIRNNSLAFKIWQRPDVQPLMKVHLFNYTNWDLVRDGLAKKLVVEDVGPYVYSQQLERVFVEFEGDQLSYQERNHFKYLPELSNGAHFDQVIVPNLPLLGVVSKAIDLNLNSFAQFSLNQILNWAQLNEPFIKLPVHRFLWGYDDTIIDAARPILSFQGFHMEKFGLLAAKNGTVSERFTINTGEKEINKMNIIQKVDGHEHLSVWGSPDCNSLESTDGSIFPQSQLDKKSTLYVYYANMCRRLPYNYEKDIEVADGIQLLRYRMPLNVFDDPSHNPENQCFCQIDSGICPPRGLINITACNLGVPALASFPHFYLADTKVLNDVVGLQPDPLQHDSFIDIHPTLGIALGGKSSLQINIQVKKTTSFSALTTLKNGLILPIAWVEMSLDELPEGLRTLVYHGTYSTAAAQLGLTVTCIIALVISGICLLLMIVRRRQRPCAKLKIAVANNEIKCQQVS